MFGFSSELIADFTDRRLKPRIPTVVVVKSSAVMFWARMGSLNALEMSAQSKFWKQMRFQLLRQWLGRPMPSADTIGARVESALGNVFAKMDASQLRDAIHQVYGKLKRNKALADDQCAFKFWRQGHLSGYRGWP